MKLKLKEGKKLYKEDSKHQQLALAVNITGFFAIVRKTIKCCCTQARITHMPMLGQEEIHPEIRGCRLFNLLPHTLTFSLDHPGPEKHS